MGQPLHSKNSLAYAAAFFDVADDELVLGVVHDTIVGEAGAVGRLELELGLGTDPGGLVDGVALFIDARAPEFVVCNCLLAVLGPLVVNVVVLEPEECLKLLFGCLEHVGVSVVAVGIVADVVADVEARVVPVACFELVIVFVDLVIFGYV